MIRRAYAPEAPLPVHQSVHPNRTFLWLVAAVATLGIAPLVVGYLASTLLS
jgi:hypothetical protein